jgi:threonine/homoserine/homoserine lactone efflux protein
MRHDAVMGTTIADVLPLAVAIAASPFTIIPVILLLFTPRARAASAAFLSGWLIALAVGATGFVLLAALIEGFEEVPTWLSWTRIVLGTILIVLGIRQWRARRTPASSPAWMQRIESATPRRAFRLSFLLAYANPKVLLLTAAAGLSIGAAELERASTAGLIAIFTGVAAISVAVPVGLFAVLGERMLGPLSRVRDWLERNNATVLAVVIIVIGVLVLAEGVSGIF